MLTGFVLVSGSLLSVSCASTPVIADNATSQELLQLGQNALEGRHYSNAIIYFQAVIDKHSTETDSVCNAQYEIGHTHYKQGKLIQAKKEFQALLDRYSQGGSDVLPKQFKILAQIGLDNVAKKERSNFIMRWIYGVKPGKAADTTTDTTGADTTNAGSGAAADQTANGQS
jgi:TolA-binding protein